MPSLVCFSLWILVFDALPVSRQLNQMRSVLVDDHKATKTDWNKNNFSCSAPTWILRDSISVSGGGGNKPAAHSESHLTLGELPNGKKKLIASENKEPRCAWRHLQKSEDGRLGFSQCPLPRKGSPKVLEQSCRKPWSQTVWGMVRFATTLQGMKAWLRCVWFLTMNMFWSHDARNLSLR